MVSCFIDLCYAMKSKNMKIILNNSNLFTIASLDEYYPQQYHHHWTYQTNSLLFSGDGTILICCGFWDNSIRMLNIQRTRVTPFACTLSSRLFHIIFCRSSRLFLRIVFCTYQSSNNMKINLHNLLLSIEELRDINKWLLHFRIIFDLPFSRIRAMLTIIPPTLVMKR